MIHTLFWPYSPAAEAVTLHTEIPPIPKDPRLRYFMRLKLMLDGIGHL